MKALLILGAAGLLDVALIEGSKYFSGSAAKLKIPAKSLLPSALKKPGAKLKPKKSVHFNETVWEKEFEKGSAPAINPYGTDT